MPERQAGVCESTSVQRDVGGESVHSPCVRHSGLGVGVVACASAELAVTSASGSVSACVAVCDCRWGGARLRGPVFPVLVVVVGADPGRSRGTRLGVGGPERCSQGSREDDRPGGSAAWTLRVPYSPGALCCAAPPSVHRCTRRR